MIRILDSSDIGNLLTRRASRMTAAEQTVRPILDDVRKRGDRALLEYARRFDHLQARTVALAQSDLEGAYRRMPADLRASLRVAARNIRAYAKLQLPQPRKMAAGPGLRISQIVRPLDCVAAYIPGGRYPLPSTLLMTAIPAQVAGVRRIVAACPRPADAVLGTAAFLKLSSLFQMGGAHAIAAFAYGTKTVPRADRIVGPGNIYVAAAKKLLAGEVGIDFVAGPTEILIIASAEASAGDARWIAADMLAQAEHDTDASAVLLTTSRRLALAVAGVIERQLLTLPTADVARQAIDRNSAIVLVGSVDEAVELSNRFAPEHLSIPDAKLLPAIRHAGSVFIGPYSPEAAGDYASGPNHVLPTSGVARIRGGLSAADFVKVISVQQLSRQALRRLTPAITTLARAEGLEAHARSVEARNQ
ncbi:MAG: histidinol dehydrogenase [Acidobacteriia bacterium]|nr:histidinol dehydrogenase [Terriglobia bacterium]